MRLFNFKLVTVAVLLIAPVGTVSLWATSDSLQVKIVNIDSRIEHVRFIERDSTNIILRVMDETGTAIKDLMPNQVQIVRGDKKAKILQVIPLEATVEKNINIVLALDNSSSMQRSARQLLLSLNLLLNTLRNKCNVSVVLFADDNYLPVKLQGKIGEQRVNVKFYKFTSDLSKLMRQIRRDYKDNLTSRTYLNDEILVGLQQFEKIPQNLLRIMIVLSDGKDLGSTFGFDKVLQAASEAGVTIYGIDYSRQPTITEPMKRLVECTPHGRVYKAKKADDLIPVFEALSREITTEFQVNYHFPVPPSGTIDFAQDSLKITTRRIKDEFPMLNYVFFDSSSAEINSRYHLFPGQAEAVRFNEASIAKSLDKYYHLLNIIGSRARVDTTARLVVTGCNMNFGVEKGNQTLSQKRAAAISQYLEEIWGVRRDRITIVTRNLPQKRSGTRTTEGRAENRRVEITSDHYDIIRPVRSEITEFRYTPEIGQFNTRIKAPEGLAGWEFHVFAKEESFFKLNFKKPQERFSWNWIGVAGEKIQDNHQLEYKINITDEDGETFEGPLQVLPIAQQEETASQAVSTGKDSVFEKFSLILFDFNSSQLSGNNQNLMQRVWNIYATHPGAAVKVYGFCDNIGSEEYNLKLSTKRAKIAYDILRRMKIDEKKLSYLGYGEINPIFSNATPEGRFLNRTVQIYIGYPKSDFTTKE